MLPSRAKMAAQPLEDTLTITPLGSGQEVGRSCHLIQFRGRTVLLDCGIHPGRSGLDALPFLDTVDLSEVDLMLVVEHEGIRFWSYNAGHVLGAAMFMIEIGGVRLLYTGDYSLEEDRHLVPAEVPTLEPHVLIMESTYGTQKHERGVRALFTSTIERIVQRGGRCLIPVFALGRAQELLLILDEYWKEREDLQRVPVFYASKMASRALRVYQTYINMMNMHVRDQMDISNPFKFDHVQNLASIDDLDDSGPSPSRTSRKRRRDRQASLDVGGCVRVDVVQADAARELVLAWDASPLGDVVAGSVVCVALHCQSSPAALLTTGPCCVPDASAADDPTAPKTPRPS
ncbi:nuclease [Aureococcus anophagefferens]|nr:nuclease [Aureococcus anophagefferens]